MINTLVFLLASTASLSSASPLNKRAADLCTSGNTASPYTTNTGLSYNLFCNKEWLGFDLAGKQAQKNTLQACIDWCSSLNQFQTIPVCYGVTWTPYYLNACYLKTAAVGTKAPQDPINPPSGYYSHSVQLTSSVAGQVTENQCYGRNGATLSNKYAHGQAHDIKCGNQWTGAVVQTIKNVTSLFDCMAACSDANGGDQVCYGASWQVLDSICVLKGDGGSYSSQTSPLYHAIKVTKVGNTNPSDSSLQDASCHNNLDDNTQPWPAPQTSVAGKGEYIVTCGKNFPDSAKSSWSTDSIFGSVAECAAFCDKVNLVFPGTCGGVTYAAYWSGCAVFGSSLTASSGYLISPSSGDWWVDAARLLPRSSAQPAPASGCGGSYTFQSNKYSVKCGQNSGTATDLQVAKDSSGNPLQPTINYSKQTFEDCAQACTAWNTKWSGQYGKQCYGVMFNPSWAMCNLKGKNVATGLAAANDPWLITGVMA